MSKASVLWAFWSYRQGLRVGIRSAPSLQRVPRCVFVFFFLRLHPFALKLKERLLARPVDITLHFERVRRGTAQDLSSFPCHHDKLSTSAR